MITLKDVLAEGSDYEIDLTKLLGKKVKEVRGYISMEFGQYSFKLTNIVFEDDSMCGVEGEHDFPYLVEYKKHAQPNLDEELFEKLYSES